MEEGRKLNEFEEETVVDEETDEERIELVEKTRTVTRQVPKGIESRQVFDEDGNPIYQGTRPVLNPDYDPTQKYISRFDRSEWAPVGMLGVLAVRHDGTLKANGYATINEDGIATACNRKEVENYYRVIKEITENVAEIIFK